jgi:hypothetical protein
VSAWISTQRRAGVGDKAADPEHVLGSVLLPLGDFDGVRTFERQMSTEPALEASLP